PLLNRKPGQNNQTDQTDQTGQARKYTEGVSPRLSSLSDSESYILFDTTLTPLEDWIFGFDHADSLLRSQLGVSSLDGFGLAGHEYAICAAGAAVHYVNETQKAQASHLSEIGYFESNDYLVLDSPTVNNLELVVSQGGKSTHSLFGVIDET